MRRATTLLALAALLIAAPAAAGDLEDRATMLEEVFDRFFSIRACAPGETPYDFAWAAYETWRAAAASARAAEQDSLSAIYASVTGLTGAIEDFERCEQVLRDGGAEANDDSLYTLERRRFGYLARRSATLAAYNEALTRHYEGQRDYIEARKAKLDSLDALVRDVEEYNLWLQAGGPRIYGGDLARLLAETRRVVRDRGDGDGRAEILERVRDLRRRLFEHTAVRNRREGVSLMLAEVEIGDESCYLYVDTGGEKVLLSTRLVEALGWEERLGEPVMLVNADGTTADARRLFIPEMTCVGRTARDVEATVLDWERPGSDGLLGMSFLDRFEVTIDEDADPPLTLKPKN